MRNVDTIQHDSATRSQYYLTDITVSQMQYTMMRECGREMEREQKERTRASERERAKVRERENEREIVKWEAIRTADQEIEAAKLVFTSSPGPGAQLRRIGD